MQNIAPRKDKDLSFDWDVKTPKVALSSMTSYWLVTYYRRFVKA
jgi:hypothetical protein